MIINVSCLICSDLFDSDSNSSAIYANECGHIFHYECILNWIARSKSCPQCRQKCTEKSINRIYFNVPSTDHIKDDVITLQHAVDNLKLKLDEQKKELTNYDEKHNKIKSKNAALRLMVIDTEKENKALTSVVHELKEKNKFFQKKVQEAENLRIEIGSLKATLEATNKVQTVLDGTKEQVQEILLNETNIEALALLAATLKKTLIQAEKKNRELARRLQTAETESKINKRQCNSLEAQVNELKSTITLNLKYYEDEKKYLKAKLIDLQSKLKDKSTTTSSNEKITDMTEFMDQSTEENPRTSTSNDDSICIESPIQLPQRNLIIKTSQQKSPSKVDSSSPYLPIKPYTGLQYSSVFGSRIKTIGYKTEQKKRLNETVYNGLGGRVREEVFPDPNAQLGKFKKIKSTSALPAKKFKKLAAPANTARLTDFTFTIDD